MHACAPTTGLTPYRHARSSTGMRGTDGGVGEGFERAVHVRNHSILVFMYETHRSTSTNTWSTCTRQLINMGDTQLSRLPSRSPAIYLMAATSAGWITTLPPSRPAIELQPFASRMAVCFTSISSEICFDAGPRMPCAGETQRRTSNAAGTERSIIILNPVRVDNV